jgi:hypothetical protein
MFYVTIDKLWLLFLEGRLNSVPVHHGHYISLWIQACHVFLINSC